MAEPTPPKPALHILQLSASNVLRLKAVRIKPTPTGLVLIGGRNEQGKTSVLASISMALGGTKEIPSAPVRIGARQATAGLDLGELVVRRTINARGSELVVTTRDGVPVKSPQGVLDALYAAIAWDPVAFATAKTPAEIKRQEATLKQAMGLDLTDLESDHAKIYEARTALNRDVNREAVLFDQMPRHDDAPDALVDIAALTTQLEEIAKHNQEASQASAEVKRGEERLEVMKRDGQALSAKIVGLEAELAAAKKAECEMAETYTFAYRDLEEMRTHLPTPLDDAPVRHKLKAADAVNTRVRENTAKTAAETALGELRAKAQGCTDALVAIEEKKRDRIAAAHFPIDGLGFDDAGPTLNGIPISQASGAQRIRLGVAIAAALNPRLRVVLVRDGSNLDDENLALLAKLAEEHDLQVWVERVSTHDAGAIIITDGEVSDYGKHGDAQPLTTDDI